MQGWFNIRKLLYNSPHEQNKGEKQYVFSIDTERKNLTTIYDNNS